MTADCFRSPCRFDTPDPARPMNPPSRGPGVIHLLRSQADDKILCEHATSWARRGGSFRLGHSVAETGPSPCGNVEVIREPRPTKMVAREPRPTNVAVTSHLSRQEYACS
jgi:hypothetical protein